MGTQFDPPPLAAPYAPRPASPRGLYRQFGAPESLLRIHFPDGDDPNNQRSTSNPWYWYVQRQRIFYFSFLGGVWGNGWQRLPIFPVIKILAIDSQPFIPTPSLGFTSVEQAAKNWNGNRALFGRFDERSQNFWDLIVRDGGGSGKNQNFPLKTKPPFNVVNGQIRARNQNQNIGQTIRQAIQQFHTNFNSLAAGYNQQAAQVSGSGGFQYKNQASPYNFPLPVGPPTSISFFGQQLNGFINGPPYLQSAAYIGPISGTAFFNINTFTTQAMAFTIGIGQLSPKKWNMSVFPPLDSTIIGNGSASSISGKYDGYGPIPFPYSGVEIM